MAPRPPPTKLASATATISLGKPGTHSISTILKAAASTGLKGIEICSPNVLQHASFLSQLPPDSEPSDDQVVSAAQDIKRQCDELGLIVIALQPFAGYEGLRDPAEHERKVSRFKLWLDTCAALDCDIIQVPSTTRPTDLSTGDLEKITTDMQEIADLAAERQPPVNLAYEALSWGTHVNLWEQSYEVVERVDRPNFGLCLDTYHIAARVFASPTETTLISQSGKTDLITSLLNLVKTVPVETIFYLQLSDAEALSSPLVEGHPFYVEGQPPWMSWSRNARLFPCEEALGGFLPVLSIAKAIVNEVGYRGWISMEVFSRHLAEEGDGVPVEFARRAMRSWGKVREKLEWEILR